VEVSAFLNGLTQVELAGAEEGLSKMLAFDADAR